MQNLNMLMLMLYVLLILILGQPEMIVTLFSKVEEMKPLCQFKPQDAYLKKGAPFHWTSDCQGSLTLLKKALLSASFLSFPDPTKTFVPTCNASDRAISNAFK